MRKCYSLYFISSIILILSLFASPAFASTLKAEITTFDSGTFDLVTKGMWINLSVIIESPVAINILKYETPVEGITKDLFIVECDGEKAPYLGPLVLRKQTVSEDYMEIDSGETVSVDQKHILG